MGDIYDVSGTLTLLRLGLDNLQTDLLAMFVFGATWRLLTLAVLRFSSTRPDLLAGAPRAHRVGYFMCLWCLHIR